MPKKINYNSQELISLILKNERMTYTELSKLYDLSLPIVRRICLEIAETSPIECLRGSVQAKYSVDYPIGYKNKNEKNSIACEAAKFVNDKDTIFIGAGTTTYLMCNYIIDKKITVITNSIPIINRLMAFPNITTIAVGGILQHEDQALVGDFFETFTKNLNADKIFIGSEGFDVHKGASRSVIQKNMTEQSVTQLSGKKILLIDHTKFGLIKAWQWLPINKIDTLITSSLIDSSSKSVLKKTGIELILVPSERDGNS
ncbi:MAG: DeoR/GlpR family DNA-binding transcription regulator [Brevinema sp.]